MLSQSDKIKKKERDEALKYVEAVKRHENGPVRSILHLGCGAGGHDFHFKGHFDTTGVDLCEEMLVMARELNPEVRYIQGDMRTVRLDRKFDAVVIPDSIMYMTTIKDVDKALGTAAMVYLVRRGEELQIHNDVHTLGLFSHNEWVGAFDRSGLHLEEEIDLDHLYDDFLAEEGEYSLKAWVCKLLK